MYRETDADTQQVAAAGLETTRQFDGLGEGLLVATVILDHAETCGDLDGGRPKSSMSHHFRVLRDAGLVQTRSVGTTHINALRADDLESRFPGLLASILGQH